VIRRIPAVLYAFLEQEAEIPNQKQRTKKEGHPSSTPMDLQSQAPGASTEPPKEKGVRRRVLQKRVQLWDKVERRQGRAGR